MRDNRAQSLIDSTAGSESNQMAALVEITMTQSYEALFELPGYLVTLLQAENCADLQALLERNPDYFQLVSGLPPNPSAAYSLLTSLPEGKTLDEKLVIGISTGNQTLIGVLDIVCNYPAQNEWWIGLLLLDPAYRRKGLGGQIHRAFEKWAIQYGVKRIWLGVIDQNQDAYRFWQKAGFEPVERRPPSRFGNVEHVVITMRRTLAR